MYGIVLVSHSNKITEGIKEMIEEMIGDNEYVDIVSCGGTDDGRLGTNAIDILDNIENLNDAKQIFVFADIGSAILSAETAIDLVDDIELKEKVVLADCPLVEGSFAAAVQASVNASSEEILNEIASV